MAHTVGRQELACEALACELVLMRTWLRQKQMLWVVMSVRDTISKTNTLKTPIFPKYKAP